MTEAIRKLGAVCDTCVDRSDYSDIILNSITDGVVSIGLDWQIKYLNKAAREMLGGAEEDICGHNCRSVFGEHLCGGSTSSCLLRRTMETGENITNYETQIRARDGRLIPVSVNTALMRDKDGKVVGGVEIFRDISLIKELKDELKNKYSFEQIVGKNYKMHEIYELLHEVAPTRTTVLIEGESGTGKELIANAIHHNSPRKGGPFIKVNCAALAEGILESELFGHMKGSFTGAIADRPGRFELANKGTIFLDEIGDISASAQAKLLRVLQEGEFERVGGTQTIKVDVRVVAATNKDLKDLASRGKFREDLYYRLKVVPIKVPALRERKDDIPLLIRHFIAKFNKEMGREINNISSRAMDMLTEYNYPGNIRELENIMEYIFVRCQGNTIMPEHLPKDLQQADRYILDKTIETEKPLESLEKEMILKVLNQSNWKLGEVAQKLGLSRTTLWRKMKSLGIEKK